MLCQLSYGHHTTSVGNRSPAGAYPRPVSSGAGIRTPIRSSKGCCPAVERPPNARSRRECRGPDLNWGHRNFQSRALPTELPRQKSEWLIANQLIADQHLPPNLRSCISHQPSAIAKRVTGFEPVTFSLARRRTTTVLHPQLRQHEADSRRLYPNSRACQT
jgi:hypothetical protein